VTHLDVIGKRVYLGVSFDLASFPAMIRQHGQNFADTLEMEVRFANRIRTPFDEFEPTREFIRAVCKWGRFAGVAGRILKRNSKKKILAAFEKARLRLLQTAPDLKAAMESLNELEALGRPSFASKHLRFMLPQKCPVYDRILNNALPYDSTPAGYAEFATDCLTISRQLIKRKIENPIRGSVTWYAADVEAAIFAAIRNKQGPVPTAPAGYADVSPLASFVTRPS
jgi:hypothetical protein